MKDLTYFEKIEKLSLLFRGGNILSYQVVLETQEKYVYFYFEGHLNNITKKEEQIIKIAEDPNQVYYTFLTGVKIENKEDENGIYSSALLYFI